MHSGRINVQICNDKVQKVQFCVYLKVFFQVQHKYRNKCYTTTFLFIYFGRDRRCVVVCFVLLCFHKDLHAFLGNSLGWVRYFPTWTTYPFSFHVMFLCTEIYIAETLMNYTILFIPLWFRISSISFG